VCALFILFSAAHSVTKATDVALTPAGSTVGHGISVGIMGSVMQGGLSWLGGPSKMPSIEYSTLSKPPLTWPLFDGWQEMLGLALKGAAGSFGPRLFGVAR